MPFHQDSVFKRLQRQKFIREIWTERITPEELLKRINAGEAVTVVDLRHPLDFLPEPRVLPNAIRILPEELEQKYPEIPRDREVVLYCT
jgi:rhodanese-related sulfurtransferase